MTKVKLEDYKNLSQPSEKELLQYIFATQLLILRRLDFLERDVRDNKEGQLFEHTLKDMIEKIPGFIKNIEEYMSLDDTGKGKLRF